MADTYKEDTTTTVVKRNRKQKPTVLVRLDNTTAAGPEKTKRLQTDEGRERLIINVSRSSSSSSSSEEEEEEVRMHVDSYDGKGIHLYGVHRGRRKEAAQRSKKRRRGVDFEDYADCYRPDYNNINHPPSARDSKRHRGMVLGGEGPFSYRPNHETPRLKSIIVDGGGGSSRGINATKRLDEVVRSRDGQPVRNPFRPMVSVSNPQRVTMYFDHIPQSLRDLLEIHRQYLRGKLYVVGCVAWLSDRSTIEALSRCSGVSLLVNNEDYSKWGNGTTPNLYKMLPAFREPFHRVFAGLDTPLVEMDKNSDTQSYAAVRAMGGRAEDGGPIMHSKYLVFCRWNREGDVFCPYAVWTGSMNLTGRAVSNMENAVFIEDATAAMAYFNDYAEAFLSSVVLRKGYQRGQ